MLTQTGLPLLLFSFVFSRKPVLPRKQVCALELVRAGEPESKRKMSFAWFP